MGIQPNTDFLNSESAKDDWKPYEKKNGEKPQVRGKDNVNDEKYLAYHALSDYHKKCLVADNYWRVMNGIPIIEVPPSDTHYHHYFDKECYGLSDAFQARKKRNDEGGNKNNANFPAETPVAVPKVVTETTQIINNEVEQVKMVDVVNDKKQSETWEKREAEFKTEKNTSIGEIGIVTNKSNDYIYSPETIPEAKSETKQKINSVTRIDNKPEIVKKRECDFEIEENADDSVNVIPKKTNKIEDRKNESDSQISLF